MFDIHRDTIMSVALKVCRLKSAQQKTLWLELDNWSETMFQFNNIPPPIAHEGMPPLEQLPVNYNMHPLEHDSFVPMPPLERVPSLQSNPIYDNMPPLERVSRYDDMPPLERAPFGEAPVYHDMPPPLLPEDYDDSVEEID
jgi:hypothetical protein